MKLKMENSTRSFRETNLVLQLILESQIKGKTVMSWSSGKKLQVQKLWCSEIDGFGKCGAVARH